MNTSLLRHFLTVCLTLGMIFRAFEYTRLNEDVFVSFLPTMESLTFKQSSKYNASLNCDDTI